MRWVYVGIERYGVTARVVMDDYHNVLTITFGFIKDKQFHPITDDDFISLKSSPELKNVVIDDEWNEPALAMLLK